MKLNHPFLWAALLVAALTNVSVLTQRADNAPRAVLPDAVVDLRTTEGVKPTIRRTSILRTPHETILPSRKARTLQSLGYSIQGDHGLLFGMALVTFARGFTVMWTYRHHIPGDVPATMY